MSRCVKTRRGGGLKNADLLDKSQSLKTGNLSSKNPLKVLEMCLSEVVRTVV